MLPHLSFSTDWIQLLLSSLLALGPLAPLSVVKSAAAATGRPPLRLCPPSRRLLHIAFVAPAGRSLSLTAAGPRRRPDQPNARSLPWLSLSRLAACTCELLPISTVPQPQGSTPYDFQGDGSADLCSHFFFFCFDAHGCRCPAGRLLRPSGTRLFAHHLLILRAMAQRPTSVEAARWWIALSHRPWLRRVPVARQAFVRYGYLVYETTLTGECACMSSKRRQY